jgi:glycosyltransferase involved in cell wall biosynthesis
MQPISLIMLVHNEAETIEAVIRSYYQQIIAKLPGSEFIIAEDGSTDGTKEILDRLTKELNLRLISGQERKGYANAFRQALTYPKNEIIFLSDSGGKHEPADFWKLYSKINEADLVIGVKTNREDSRFRRLLTWGYNKIINLYFGSNFHDIDSGFRLVKKSMVDKISKKPWLFKELIASEFTLRLWGQGSKIAEVPVTYHARLGPSRGLPLKKIPRAIGQALINLPKLKREMGS